jgi:hypothetical protein
LKPPLWQQSRTRTTRPAAEPAIIALIVSSEIAVEMRRSVRVSVVAR